MTILETMKKILSAPGKAYLLKQYLIAFGIMIFYIVSNVSNGAYSVLTASYIVIVLFNALLLPYSLYFLKSVGRYISGLFSFKNFIFSTNIPFIRLGILYVLAFGFAFIFAPLGFVCIYFKEVKATPDSIA